MEDMTPEVVNQENHIYTYSAPSRMAKWFPPLLATAVTLASFYLFYVFINSDCKAPREITFYILGSVNTLLTTILTYYFGSSESSSRKSELLAQQNQTQQTQQSRTLEPIENGVTKVTP